MNIQDKKDINEKKPIKPHDNNAKGKKKVGDDKTLSIKAFFDECKEKGWAPLKIFWGISIFLTIIYFFSFFIFTQALIGTPAANKIVIGCLTLYITCLFILTDLIPSSSPSKKWFSISCRILTVIATILSISFYI